MGAVVPSTLIKFVLRRPVSGTAVVIPASVTPGSAFIRSSMPRTNTARFAMSG